MAKRFTFGAVQCSHFVNILTALMSCLSQAPHNFPDDAFFPFSVAMNALLERNDTELALDWMQRAANKDTAPPWYKAAVGGLLKEGQGQDASIRYLEEQLKDENLRPNVRSLTEYRLNLLRHEMAQSQLEHLRDQWRDTHEEPLDDLNMLGDIPADPFGVGWVQSGDGRIRSKMRLKLKKQKSR